MKRSYLLIPILLLLTLLSCKRDEIKCNADDDFDLKASKMEQVGGLFSSIARQPEMAKYLIQSAEINYSNYTELLPISDKAIVQRGKARGAAFSLLFDAIARQPEAFNLLDSAATKFLGVYDQSYISDELLDITKTYAVAGLNDALARQPEADSLFNLVTIKYLNFRILYK